MIHPAHNERGNCLDCMCYSCTGNYSNRSDGYTRLKLGGVIFYLLQVSHVSATENAFDKEKKTRTQN